MEHACFYPLQSLCKYSNFLNASRNLCFFFNIFGQSRVDRGQQDAEGSSKGGGERGF